MGNLSLTASFSVSADAVAVRAKDIDQIALGGFGCADRFLALAVGAKAGGTRAANVRAAALHGALPSTLKHQISLQ
jgi:hypothetical protein